MKKRNWITVNCSMIFLFQDFFFFPFLSYQRKVKKVPRGKIDYLQNSCNKKAGKKKRGGEELSRAKIRAVFGRRMVRTGPVF